MNDKHLTDIEQRLSENYADILRLDVIADVRALMDDVRTLKAAYVTTWMDGPPPADVFVWRKVDGFDHPVRTGYRSGVLSFISAHDPGGWQPWGTARWAPIPQPSDKVPVVQATPAQSPTVVLDSMTVEQIEAYLRQRKREKWLAHGCGDGFKRLLVERDLTEFILPPGCWVWRDANGQIRRAFGWVDGPNFTKQIMLWVTFDEDERAITSNRLWAIPTSPFEDRSTRNLAWLAEVRAWLLTQPIERTG